MANGTVLKIVTIFFSGNIKLLQNFLGGYKTAISSAKNYRDFSLSKNFVLVLQKKKTKIGVLTTRHLYQLQC